VEVPDGEGVERGGRVELLDLSQTFDRLSRDLRDLIFLLRFRELNSYLAKSKVLLRFAENVRINCLSYLDYAHPIWYKAAREKRFYSEIIDEYRNNLRAKIRISRNLLYSEFLRNVIF